jgi:23S rRNA (uracil1939-C5)-methyltransferase
MDTARQSVSRRRAPVPTVVATVETVDAAGCGVVRIDGRSLLVDGALTGESVVCRPRRGRRQGHRADLVEVLEAAPARVAPVCPHFGLCGGCRLQHMPGDAQLVLKEQGLLRALRDDGDVAPDTVLAPLCGPVTGYRRRARLGVKYVPGKGGVLVGFREKHGAKLAELDACAILEPGVGESIGALRRMLGRLTIRNRIPQLEVSMGDSITALVLRHLDPMPECDARVLVDFVRARDWQLYLQPGGPDSVHPLWPGEPAPLSYRLPDFDLELAFLPPDFVQVNGAMNRALVASAVGQLNLRRDSRVLDLFCGIGNFTLAAARRGAEVTGVEGSTVLVSRARSNANRNRIDNAHFVAADLIDVDAAPSWWRDRWDRLLLDPPRSGAGQLLNALKGRLPPRIVYVSCNPQTLARDAGVLVHEQGYRLRHVGVVDMFPHTSHCEAMAVFDRRDGS